MPAKAAEQNGSCRTISIDSTATTSPTTSETMLLNHDYADPVELRESIKLEMENIDRQKRQNLIYEPMTTTKTKQKDFNNIDTEKTQKCSLHNLCLLFVFLVSSCSLTLSLLITFGVIETKGSDIQEQYNPLTAKVIGRNGDITSEDLARTQEDDEKRIIVEGLKKNISILNEQIPSFVRKLAVLQSKLNKLSPTGSPPAPTTPPVKKSGKLSKCRYKTEVSNVPYRESHPPYTTTAAKTMWLTGEQGFELVGASCSTLGGTEYRLSQKVRNGRMLFRCTCAGKSEMAAFKAEELECRMHYWECPINTTTL